MRMKMIAILVIIACIFGAAHYNDHVTVSVTLPSPAEVVDAVGKAAEEVKDTEGIHIRVLSEEEAYEAAHALEQ